MDSSSGHTTSSVSATPTITIPATTYENSVKMDNNVIVVNPSTTTVITIKTIELASTITDHNIAVVTLPPVTTSLETVRTDVLTAIGTYQPTVTLTQTSVGITYYLQDTAGVVYSTSTTGWLIAPTRSSEIHEVEGGFNGWSSGAKAGLIIGVIFATLIMILLFVCCYKRNARWIAHDWRWGPQVEGGIPGMANANLYHPGSVASPMTVVSTPPSYQYGYPSYGYMRGGAGPKNWFGRFADKLSKWKAGKTEDAEQGADATPIRVLREMREATGQRRDPNA